MKTNFKDSSKSLQAQIKEQRKLIGKCEEKLETLGRKRDSLTNELLTVQGQPAALIAKDLGLCGQEIEQLEDQLLDLLETLDMREKELEDLRK